MSDYISREEFSDNLCYGISCNECSFNTTSDGQSGCLLQERIDNLPCADVISIEECERRETKAYFDGEAYGWEQGRKALIDDVKAEIDEQYDRIRPYNIDVAEGLEMALDILDNIGKAESEDKE